MALLDRKTTLSILETDQNVLLQKFRANKYIGEYYGKTLSNNVYC